MITYKDWFSFLVLVSCCIPTRLWGFSYSLNKHSIQVGESATLSISLPNKIGNDKPLVIDDLLDRHPNLKVLERNTSQTDTGVTITFELTAYQASQLRIPPIQVKWGPDTFSTEALELSVTSTRNPDDMEIRADFGRLRPPFPWRKAYLGLIFFLGTLLLLWLIRWSFLRIQWKKLLSFSWTFTFPSFETDRMWLRKEIARFKNQIRKGNAPPEIVDQILYSLMVFLKRRTKAPAPALTRKELEQTLHEKQLRSKTRSLLAQVDDFKYHSLEKMSAPELAEELIARIESEFL